MRWYRIAVPTLALAGAMGAAACSSDNGVAPQPIPPGGTYAYVSGTLGGASFDSGYFRLHDTSSTYRVQLYHSLPDTIIADSGTYTFSAPNNVTLHSLILSPGTPIPGTYTYNSSTGDFAVTIPSEAQLNFKKQ